MTSQAKPNSSLSVWVCVCARKRERDKEYRSEYVLCVCNMYVCTCVYIYVINYIIKKFNPSTLCSYAQPFTIQWFSDGYQPYIFLLNIQHYFKISHIIKITWVAKCLGLISSYKTWIFTCPLNQHIKTLLNHH